MIRAGKIIRSSRRTLGITVTPAGELVVHAPRLIPEGLINRFLEEKKDWIEKSLHEVNHRPKLPKRTYGEGDEFLYLGKMYSLHFAPVPTIRVKEQLEFPQILKFRVQKELENWYVRQAKQLIPERVAYFAEEMGTSYKTISFSETISKWGSCTHDNHLQFRWKLIMAPLVVIDYVVVHELAHTMEHNHSSAFWTIVRRYKPAYRQYKKWLEDHGNLLVI